MPLSAAIPCSSPLGQRRIIRKLYEKLKHFQADDVPIPNPTVLEIKFYLKTNRRCYTIFIEKNDNIPHFHPVVSIECIPRFIASQLEAQRIADQLGQSVQLSTVLGLLIGHLVIDPVRIASVPTLFFWHDTQRRRTFCIFAYLARTMESRTYSVAELLNLRRSRSSETSHGLPAKVKEDPEFGDVVSKSDRIQAQVRGAKKQKEVSSSSVEDEEVAFQAKSQLRQSTEAVPKTQWKYRGRLGTEIAASDPLPAPTGLDKQSSEGFQKFFKAVVSPTHVRVTASGRIVPNTRGSASPTMKCDKERVMVDAQRVIEPSKEKKVELIQVPTNNQLSAPVVPAVYNNQPMIYQHLGMPIPLYQPVHGSVQNGFAYPYGLAPVPPQVSNTPYLTFPGGVQGFEAMGDNSKRSGGENSNNLGRVPIKISPPDQFDQNRPFYANGQLVLPPTSMTQGQMAPIIPYLPTGAMATPAYSGQRMAVMNQPVNNMSMTGPNGHLPSSNLAHHQAISSAVTPPGSVPLSSIRPSEITRKQLDGLKNSLKYYVGQLEYNRHQIDEPWVNAQVQRLREDIEQFELTLDMQIQYELVRYPGMEPMPQHPVQVPMPLNTHSRQPSMRHTRESDSSHHGSIRSITAARPRHTQSHYQAGTGNRGGYKSNRKVIGINSNITDSSAAHIDALETAIVNKFSISGATTHQKKMLEAITRPPNPKVDPKSSTAQQPSSDISSKESIGQPDPSGGNQTAQAGSYQQKPEQKAQSGGANLLNGITSYPGTGLPNRNGAAIPYLVGNCPPGIDPYTYQGREFMYVRELTEPEKFARDLYWNQLPNSGMSLPKFDGKDFYPTSPQKTPGLKGGIRNAPLGRPDVNLGFEPRRSEVDPFRSSRDGDSIRSYESGRKFSKAIPIVAPPDMDKKSTSDTTVTKKAEKNEGSDSISKLNESLRECQLSRDESSAKQMEKKSTTPTQRVVERSSTKSGHDLWQTMLKKGSTSGNVLPSAISSTTATGFLPQFSGNAVASLGPTISNGSSARVSPNADDKFVELEGPRQAMEKIGENCPPSSASSMEHNIKKDLHQRMLRDAERRGVIGSDWQ
ncbi:hypothetical protein GGS21DRAFT_544427 [Xylaria nigripes]|nr:hypothetical protein GGS21DRAFT_544427 [Xylaria nigripes]